MKALNQRGRPSVIPGKAAAAVLLRCASASVLQAQDQPGGALAQVVEALHQPAE